MTTRTMKMYMYHPETQTYRNAGTYSNQGAPFNAPTGFDWVIGVPPEGMQRYQKQDIPKSIQLRVQQFFLGRVAAKFSNFKANDTSKRQFGKIMQVSVGLDRAFELAEKFPSDMYKDVLKTAVQGCILDADVPVAMAQDKIDLLAYATNLIDTEVQ